MIEEYQKDKYNFMPRTDKDIQPNYTIDGQQITVEAFELRKPGLFKEEARKNKEIALCSKMYCCADDDNDGKAKLTCKGIQHKRYNEMTFPRYYDVLFKGKDDEVLNVGFKLHKGNIKYYEQKKKGLSYCYSKRVVLADGVSTKPLDI